MPWDFVETEFNGDELIHLAEEISRQYSIQAVAWILLAAFSYSFTDNDEEKAEWKGF
jgi:hypothetical protein